MIDGRNLYDPETMAAHGLTYYSVGRAPALPEGSARRENACMATSRNMNSNAPWLRAAPASLDPICATLLLGDGYSVVAADNL